MSDIQLKRLDYSDYKRHNDLRRIEELSKSMDKKKSDSQDTLNTTVPDDEEFFNTLDQKLKIFVQAVQEIRRTHDAHINEEYVTVTSAIPAHMEAIIDELKQSDLLSDLNDTMVLDKDEWEGSQIPINVSVFPVLIKPLFRQLIEEGRMLAKQVMLKGKLASGIWPPPNAAMEMLQSTIPCVLAVKKLSALGKATAVKARKDSSAERKKKEQWRRECMQNERVKQLFHVWERQMKGNDDTTTLPGASKEEIILLEDSLDGVMIEASQSTPPVPVLKGATPLRIMERLVTHTAIGMKPYFYGSSR